MGKITYDRNNSPEYWDKIWARKGRRYEKYSMQFAWWKIDEAKAKSVLDLGCGNGRLLFGIKDKCETFGIDISAKAIERMKREFGVEGMAMSIYDIDKLGKTFDFIVCNHTLEHIYRDEEVMQKSKAILNKGGTFFCAVPNDMSGPEDTDEHVRKYTEASLKKVMLKVFGNCGTRIIGNHLCAWAKT